MRGRGCVEHGNRISSKRAPDRYQPTTICKQPASTVPYGECVARGRYVWCAYGAEGELIAVAATAPEARAKFRAAMRRRAREEYSERKTKYMDTLNRGTPIE
jgi:heme exporter protein D